MKKIKITLSLLLALSVIVMSVITAFSAGISTVSSEKITWKDKLDENLRESLLSAKDNEKIPVWVWLSDIDMNEVEKEVEKQTELNEEKISSLERAKASQTLLDAWDNDDSYKLEKEFNSFLESSKELREQNNKLIDTYFSAKIKVSAEKYSKHNSSVIEKLGVSKEDISFQSNLTPIFIANLTKKQIEDIAHNDEVFSVSFYEELESKNSVIDNTTYETTQNRSRSRFADEKSTMRVNKLPSNLTGEGINILQIDAGYVRETDPSYVNIINPDKIRNIVDGVVYQISDTPFPSGNSTHGTYVASVLQNFAENANIYNVGKYKYYDIEYAIEHCNIDLVNGSVSYGESSYYSIADRWYDFLINNYRRTFVLSAGNHISEGQYGQNVISPSNGYNCIAVGAYSTNGISKNDTMFNYRYNPTSGNTVTNYKPDVVIAAGDTSTAAPTLTGIMALILQNNRELKCEPETLKAIVCASCHRKVKPFSIDEPQENINDGLTQKQGAGALDAVRAYSIVLHESYGNDTICNGDVIIPNTITTNYNDSVNVSISWLRYNVGGNTHDPNDSITLGAINELQLRVFDSDNMLVKSSLKTNTEKQMAYFQNASPDTEYKLKVSIAEPSTTNVKFGFAWSERGDSELSNANISGKFAVNQTINIQAMKDNYQYANSDEVSYKWQCSVNGSTWTDISGATFENYTLTNSDFLKYIRCVVSPLESSSLGNHVLSSASNIKVIIFGDVDLDGTVTSVDATSIQKYLARLIMLDNEQSVAADVDGDGSITTVDATLIQKFLAHMIDIFPIEE